MSRFSASRHQYAAAAALWLRCFVLMLCGFLLAACATRPLPAEALPVDLQRFMGQWHVISHVPYFGERGHVASIDEFTLRADGEIGIRYLYRTGFSQPLQVREARATVKQGTGNREWRTWLLRVLPTNYRILEVAPDYAWALVAQPDSDLAWILGREAVMDAALYQDLERRIRDYGVDTDKMRRVPQVPAQVGRLGFSDSQDP
jgi:apolipoprotein D and lipocalin family protein